MYNSIFYRIMEWIMRFAYIQVLWIAFTLLGLVVFGLFPATTAAFSITRKWLMGETDIPITRTFLDYFKNEFLKSNLLGLIISIGIILIFINVTFIDITAIGSITFIHMMLFAIILLYSLFLFYLFPAFVHFEGGVFKVMKTAFLFMLISPVHTLMMTISLSALGIIIYFLPPLAFIFGITAYAFTTTWAALKAFQRVNAQPANSEDTF